MSEHKAKIRFANDVWKKIKWFTYNFPTEIGALGKTKLVKDKETGEKYMYVYKLLFPQQKVSGATVKFTPADWGPLVKEHGLKGLSDVAFYWHRHPGSSAHSGTDDEDTFEAFMSKEAGRKYFGFLQTAVNSASGWNSEARLDIATPIRHTIIDKDILLEVDESPEEEELRKECEAIAKDCIIKEEVKPVQDWSKYDKKGMSSTHRHYGYGNSYDSGWKNFQSCVATNTQKTLDEAIDDGQYGKITGKDDFDNDILDGIATAIDEKLSIKFENGQATIIAGKLYAKKLEEVLKKAEKGKLSQFVGSWKKEKGKNYTKYNLQPKAKMYTEMKTSLIRSYFVFCSAIKEQIQEDLDMSEEELRIQIKDAVEQSDKEAIQMLIPSDIEETMTIEGVADVRDTLIFLEEDCLLDWVNVYNAKAYDLEGGEPLGSLSVTEGKKKLDIYGTGLVWVVKCIHETLEYSDLEEGELANVEDDSKEEEE